MPEIVGSANPEWQMPEIPGSARAEWRPGPPCQKTLAVPELSGAIADVDIEAEISRARTYSMELPAAVTTGILILGDATSAIKVAGVLLIMLGTFASESRGVSEEDRAEPSNRAMSDDPVRASPEIFRL